MSFRSTLDIGLLHYESILFMANLCLSKRVSSFCSEQLRFKAAASVLPHPDKVDKGGEDAYFIAEDGLALGTFLLCSFPK